jgi:hypothetical protein
VWLQWSASHPDVRAAFRARGVRVVAGCVLLHWDVDHAHGIAKGRHICHVHGNLEHATRIRVDEHGNPRRVQPTPPGDMPWASETCGTKWLALFWKRRQTWGD